MPGDPRMTMVVTDRGLRIAIFLTRVHTRLVRPGLADLLADVDSDTALRRQFNRLLNAAIDAEILRHKLIA